MQITKNLHWTVFPNTFPEGTYPGRYNKLSASRRCFELLQSTLKQFTKLNSDTLLSLCSLPVSFHRCSLCDHLSASHFPKSVRAASAIIADSVSPANVTCRLTAQRLRLLQQLDTRSDLGSVLIVLSDTPASSPTSSVELTCVCVQPWAAAHCEGRHTPCRNGSLAFTPWPQVFRLATLEWSLNVTKTKRKSVGVGGTRTHTQTEKEQQCELCECDGAIMPFRLTVIPEWLKLNRNYKQFHFVSKPTITFSQIMLTI